MKHQISSEFQDISGNDLWAVLISKTPYKETYREGTLLAQIMLVIPISAAECEKSDINYESH